MTGSLERKFMLFLKLWGQAEILDEYHNHAFYIVLSTHICQFYLGFLKLKDQFMMKMEVAVKRRFLITERTRVLPRE